MEYLMEQSRKTGNPIHIQHALNGGEHRIPGSRYRVDGFCAAEHKVLEFHGVCTTVVKSVFPQRTEKRQKTPHTHQSMDELYALTLEKRNVLNRWATAINVFGNTNLMPKLRAILTSSVSSKVLTYNIIWTHATPSLVDVVMPQDYTVRCQVMTNRVRGLCKSVSVRECIQCLSRCVIITSDFLPLTEYFGIAKVTILPPRGLYHPVLPYTSGGKLKFPLCRTCANEEQLEPCCHSDRQRALTWTWCTPELHEALRKGYKVLKNVRSIPLDRNDPI